MIRTGAALGLVVALSACSDDSSSTQTPADGGATDGATEASHDAPSDVATADATTDDAGIDAPADAALGDPVIVAVGYGGRRMRSLDLGDSWTDLIEDDPNGGDDPNLLRAATFAQGLFVAVGWRIWTSADGAAWTERTVDGQQWCGGVAYGNGRFVCAGGCGSTLRSNDGLSWQSAGDATPAGCTHIRSLAFGAGVFVAFGDGGFAVTTTDGETWTPEQAVGGRDVVHRSGEFIANGDGVHYTSPDGLSWTEHSGEANTHDFGHGVYLRGQWKGKIERSTDGNAWSSVFDDGGNSLESFAFGYVP